MTTVPNNDHPRIQVQARVAEGEEGEAGEEADKDREKRKERRERRCALAVGNRTKLRKIMAKRKKVFIYL